MSSELDAVALCREYGQKRWSIDFYATSIFASMVTIFGVFGNAATLLTLSGRRLTTATFVYYRTIAEVDLLRCLFVFTYVLRVLLPFRRYYWTTWYEAHFMYFAISTLGFVSTSLAVFLCFRLCTGIVKSTRLKKTKTNPRETRKVIYCVLAAALLVNVWLCFEYDVLEVKEDDCSMASMFNSINDDDVDDIDDISMGNETDAMRTIVADGPRKFSLAPSDFNFRYSILLRAVHNIPTAILLVLLGGTVCLLVLCVLTLPGLAHQTSTSILTNHNEALRRSKPWRTQRQLCHLFIFLSVSYGAGLLPSLLHYFAFGTDAESVSEWTTVTAAAALVPSMVNGSLMNETTTSAAPTMMLMIAPRRTFDSRTNGTTEYSIPTSTMGGASSLDAYERELADLTRRHMFATVMNVFQNFAHALSFYVYAACSEAFRNEFLIKARMVIGRLFAAFPCLAYFVSYSPIAAARHRGASSTLLRQNAVIVRSTDQATPKPDTQNQNRQQHEMRNVDEMGRRYNSAYMVRKKVLLSEGDDEESEHVQVAAVTVL